MSGFNRNNVLGHWGETISQLIFNELRTDKKGTHESQQAEPRNTRSQPLGWGGRVKPDTEERMTQIRAACPTPTGTTGAPGTTTTKGSSRLQSAHRWGNGAPERHAATALVRQGLGAPSRPITSHRASLTYDCCRHTHPESRAPKSSLPRSEL